MAQAIAIKVIKETSDEKDQNSWYESNIWKLNQLGVKGSVTERQLSINFINFHQDWLRELVKKYLKICAINGSAAKLVQSISALKLFSTFLLDMYPDINAEDINRNVIEDYLLFLNKKSIKPTTKNNRMINLSGFLKMCHTRKWIANIDPLLVHPEDHIRIPKNIPRFIPETVIQQLQQNVSFLDDNLRRMFLILLDCGMRISEICALKYNCLQKDSDDDNYLKIFQFKLKKEYTIPISKYIYDLILEQQNAVKVEWGGHELLFPVPKKIRLVNGQWRETKSAGYSWRRKTLVHHLNDLAKQKKIISPSGELWHFDTHSFRHTTATRMINSGTPQHIVQRFLGHESPTMTSRYAFIYDETLKHEFSKFEGKLVNIAGELIKPEKLIDDIAIGTDVTSIDSKWLKKNILMQALPNGTCALPVVSNKCPHANACLTCTNFRTDKRYLNSHKTQLEQTIKIIDIAKTNSWKRQEEMNIPVKENLEKIISTLEQE